MGANHWMETKQDRIVDAAGQLFYRDGFRKVSMGDIAEAAQMSRPSLYAAFDNKEAIFSALVHRQRDKYQRDTVNRLRGIEGLSDRLLCVFDIWVIEPAAAALASEYGTDLLCNCADYAPDAIADLYAHFEAHLAAVIRPEISGRLSPPAPDMAFILRSAATGIRAATDSLPQLRRLVAGLITMTLATVKAP